MPSTPLSGSPQSSSSMHRPSRFFVSLLSGAGSEQSGVTTKFPSGRDGVAVGRAGILLRQLAGVLNGRFQKLDSAAHCQRGGGGFFLLGLLAFADFPDLFQGVTGLGERGDE